MKIVSWNCGGWSCGGFNIDKYNKNETLSARYITDTRNNKKRI